MSTVAAARAAVFVDVDDTLVHGVTLFDFLAWWSLREDPTGTALDALRTELAARRRDGRPRQELNRLAFTPYRGREVARTRADARTWWAERTAAGDPLRSVVVERLRAHRAAGAAVVLVSGSFDAVLAPVAAAVDADAVLCSTPAVAGGRYTGDVEPLVGDAKPAAVLRWCAEQGVDPARCAAYGDHASDLDVLEAVGHPVVVAGDAVLDAVAAGRGWPVLAREAAPVTALAPAL